ncbi:class I SAM-dependent methyltransferase [Paenibacillus polymyxa]|uniref:class I SAM-dependent methyltransferase n=1 Tax=Paenibacillus polymyxa TaxID=1406 RepID=UPI002023F6EB|nr:class I SAM-dependent methyltransferase [Paenibacillus polymyxa]URJ62421.3 class I SAM-dependent methyltransferase [Paenibacillus polymyxa]
MLEKDTQEILAYYDDGGEIGRLERGIGKIELERSKEIISRYLSESTHVIYDIGGGVGVYSSWLAELGYEVHLFDLSPQAIEFARQQQLNNPIISKLETADARNLDRKDESADIVLLMGPLYHLTEQKERVKALQEAARVLKKGGTLITSAISRFGSLLWGLSVYGERNTIVEEDAFMDMVRQELTDGQHVRPAAYPSFIARSYFHTSDTLRADWQAAGLPEPRVLGVEGPIWIAPGFEEKWAVSSHRSRLLDISRQVEEQESVIGMSPHMLAVGTKS